MHIFPYFLIKTDSASSAEGCAREFLNDMTDCDKIDYGNIADDEETRRLDKVLQDVQEALAQTEGHIEDNLKLAEAFRKEGDRRMWGHHLALAGNLLAQRFCRATCVWNAITNNYAIPDDPENWYAVVLDCHI
jgi:hypothetical protein